MTTDVLERTTCSPSTVTQAYCFAIDPPPEQANALRSHVGGSRLAYNALLGLVAANWEENREKKAAGLGVTKVDYLSTSHCSTAGPTSVTN